MTRTGRSEAHVKPADRIRFLMERKKWTKKKLAEESGVSYGRVLSAINENHFSRPVLEAFAQTFRCSIDWILGMHPDQLKELVICDKPLCGMKAAWVVVREGMPDSEGLKCCDDHDNYFFSRDRVSRVIPIATWLREYAARTTRVEIVGGRKKAQV